MMLHYMYEHFIDKFEWFLRADDDVFIKPDKLETFLRRVDSTKAQFIGKFNLLLIKSFYFMAILLKQDKQVEVIMRSLACCLLSLMRTFVWEDLELL